MTPPESEQASSLPPARPQGAPSFVVDAPAGVGAGDHLTAELLYLLDRVDCHVAGARDYARLSLKGLVKGLQHLPHEVGAAVSGSFETDWGAPPVDLLAGEGAGLVAVGNALVLAEHITDLARPYPGITGRDVDVLANVSVKLGHVALAEAHHLAIRLTFGVEVGSALAAAYPEAQQTILEDLFKAQEFYGTEVHRRVEAQAALVRA